MKCLEECHQLLICWQQRDSTSCIMSCREPRQHCLWLQDVFVGWAISLGDNSALLQIALYENQHLVSIWESTSPAWQLGSVSQLLLTSHSWPEYMWRQQRFICNVLQHFLTILRDSLLVEKASFFFSTRFQTICNKLNIIKILIWTDNILWRNAQLLTWHMTIIAWINWWVVEEEIPVILSKQKGSFISKGRFLDHYWKNSQ